MKLREELKNLFGHDRFRPGQEVICEKAIEGKDVLAVMPTGAGKSLCYQLPAMLLPHTTIVISPLIALMKDQLEGLPPDLQERATLINSTLTGEEIAQRIKGVAQGQYKMLYVAPERLRQMPFLHALRKAGISRFVIDEAHCINLWGHDFRPDYFFLRHALEQLGSPPVLALTATASGDTCDQIVHQLGRRMEVIQSAAYRPNLHFEAVCVDTANQKLQALVDVCKKRRGSGIVYMSSREKCEETALLLRRNGVQAIFYHAGMPNEERHAAQEAFISGEKRIVVATVAFGMGIDKPDVRFIVHSSLPKSVENYVQEAGRAGRDGLPSSCILLHTKSDKTTLRSWVKRESLKLDMMSACYRALNALLPEKAGTVSIETLSEQAQLDETEAKSAIGFLEKSGLLKRHLDCPRFFMLSEGKAEMPAELRPLFEANADETGEWSVSAVELSSALNIPLPQLEPRLLGWRDEGSIRFRASNREMLIELPPPTKEARLALDEALAKYERSQIERVEDIAAYASTEECRAMWLSRYFGEPLKQPCGECDNCTGKTQVQVQNEELPEWPEEDPGLLLLKALRDAPFSLGMRGLVRLVMGTVDSTVRGDRSRFFGCLKMLKKGTLERGIQELVDKGFLEFVEKDEFRLLALTPDGVEACGWDELPLFSVQPPKPKAVKPQKVKSDDAPVSEDDLLLFEALRSWRTGKARELHLPPYCVLNDRTLKTLAQLRPVSSSDLLRVNGVGPVAVEKYGEDVLRIIGNF